MSSDERREKMPARAALRTHDRLQEVSAHEPDPDTDPDAWLTWHATEYRPAYNAWDQAMNALAETGYEGSRHPFNFRPYCLDILASSKPPSSPATAPRDQR